MIRTLSGSPNIPHRFGYAGTTTAYTQGCLLYRDTTSGVLIPGDGSSENSSNIEGIAVKTFTSGTPGQAEIEYIPILPNELYVFDCTNTTAANQIHKNHTMTNSLNLANTSTSITSTVGFVVATSLGPTTTQLIGYFCKTGQKT